MTTELKFSPRRREELSSKEVLDLESYIKESHTPFADIKVNTGISRLTVLNIIKRGWGENAGITKLRAFLNVLSQTKP